MVARSAAEISDDELLAHPQVDSVVEDSIEPENLLEAIREAKQHLDQIKRFDMPGFQPRPEYVREMKRYRILPKEVDSNTSIDVYATDHAYWKSLWYPPRP